MWGEEGVCVDDFGPDGALDGGFDFGFCAGGDAEGLWVSMVGWPRWRDGKRDGEREGWVTDSFLNMFRSR